MLSSQRRRFRLGRIFLLVVLGAVAVGGCATRTIRETISDAGGIEVTLRHQQKGRTVIAREFGHPVAISATRLAHILARIDVEDREAAERERRNAISTDLLTPLSEALSAAFERANSDQEIAIVAIRRERRFGVFTRKFLTSFVAYRKNDLLHVHLSRIDWEIPKQREERLPEPRAGDRVMDFRAIPTDGMRNTGSQSLAVSWRDPVFAQARRIQPGVGTKIRRRTILMDSPIPDEEAGGATDTDPLALPPEALRELADLEEQRQTGILSEAEYRLRRDAVLRRHRP
ncbi:MAG: DMAP1-binding domain-containing protein [Proteobacteria bacterium]|nr:DMAP1-binding domain-containing protein [Pseudomonadota bacterium]